MSSFEVYTFSLEIDRATWTSDCRNDFSDEFCLGPVGSVSGFRVTAKKATAASRKLIWVISGTNLYHPQGREGFLWWAEETGVDCGGKGKSQLSRTLLKTDNLGHYYMTKGAVNTAANFHKAQLVLFDFESSPFCRRVRKHLGLLRLPHLVKPCPRATILSEGLITKKHRWRREAKALLTDGQPLRFPLLKDDDVSVVGSLDILRHLYSRYSKDEKQAKSIIEWIGRAEARNEKAKQILPFLYALNDSRVENQVRVLTDGDLLPEHLFYSFHYPISGAFYALWGDDLSEHESLWNIERIQVVLHGREENGRSKAVRSVLNWLQIPYLSIPQSSPNDVPEVFIEVVSKQQHPEYLGDRYAVEQTQRGDQRDRLAGKHVGTLELVSSSNHDSDFFRTTSWDADFLSVRMLRQHLNLMAGVALIAPAACKFLLNSKKHKDASEVQIMSFEEIDNLTFFLALRQPRREVFHREAALELHPKPAILKCSKQSTGDEFWEMFGKPRRRGGATSLKKKTKKQNGAGKRTRAAKPAKLARNDDGERKKVKKFGAKMNQNKYPSISRANSGDPLQAMIAAVNQANQRAREEGDATAYFDGEDRGEYPDSGARVEYEDSDLNVKQKLHPPSSSPYGDREEAVMPRGRNDSLGSSVDHVGSVDAYSNTNHPSGVNRRGRHQDGEYRHQHEDNAYQHNHHHHHRGYRNHDEPDTRNVGRQRRRGREPPDDGGIYFPFGGGGGGGAPINRNHKKISHEIPGAPEAQDGRRGRKGKASTKGFDKGAYNGGFFFGRDERAERNRKAIELKAMLDAQVAAKKAKGKTLKREKEDRFNAKIERERRELARGPGHRESPQQAGRGGSTHSSPAQAISPQQAHSNVIDNRAHQHQQQQPPPQSKRRQGAGGGDSEEVARLTEMMKVMMEQQKAMAQQDHGHQQSKLEADIDLS
eukprot:jgi/Bigna1/81398/fgenesh1_pg.80_\